jgi:AcrR family transcriptional regulator
MKELRGGRQEARGAGRPRSAQADEQIINAALDLLATVGFDRITMEGVAERAGVSKATLYLRWSSKEDLIVTVIGRFVSDITIPDTGAIEGDLLHLMRAAVRVYSGRYGAVMTGLASALAYSPRLAESLREHFLKPRLAALRTVLERAVERGELRDDLDYELALDFLGGPLFYRLLITGGPLDEGLSRGVVSTMLRGLAA